MLRMIIFGLFATSIWAAVHLYLGHRLIHQTRLNPDYRKYAWALVAAHGVLAPIASFVRRLGARDSWLNDTLTLVSYIGMGFVVTLLVYILVKDLIHAGVLLVDRLRDHRPDQPNLDRRNLLAGSFNLAAFGLAGVSTAAGYRNAVREPELKEVEVPIEGLPQELDGYTIVQISDVHVGETIKGDFLEALVERTNALKPDLVALTGDLTEGYVKDIGDQVRCIGDLKATDGVCYVTGNHEYYWDGPGWASFVADQGVHVLLNEHRVVERGRAKLVIGGVTDYKAGRILPDHATDPFKAIEGAPEHDFSLLLAHQPTSVYDARKAGWDMQISGHTHGGQFFPWNFFVGLYHEFSAGLGRLGAMWIYVSSGVGYWGPPNRLGAPSELTVIRLKRA